MNDSCIDFGDNFDDIGNIGEIFPELEPFLDDVTNLFEAAKTKHVQNHHLEPLIDGSDSDSGISGDSLTNSLRKVVDLSIPKNISVIGGNVKRIKILPNLKLPDKTNSEHNSNQKMEILVPKFSLKRPISIISNVNSISSQTNGGNIIPKITDNNTVLIKSCNFITQQKEGSLNKMTSLRKVTPVKIFKSNNDGYPVYLNAKSEKVCTDPNFINSDNKLSNILSPPPIIMDSKSSVFSVKSDNNNKNSISNNISNNSSTYSFDDDLDNFMDIPFLDDFPTYESPITNGFKPPPIASAAFNTAPLERPDTAFQSPLSSSTSVIHSNLLDQQQVDRLIKKQERMIKNRQAASLSRQRKKEYVERLEQKVDQLKHENQFLQSQFSEFREQYSALEQENMMLKKDVQNWRDQFYEGERRKAFQNSQLSSSSNSHCCTKDVVTVKVKELSSSTARSKALKTTASTTILGIFILITLNFSFLNFGKSFSSTRAILTDPSSKVAGPGRGGLLGNSFVSHSRLGRTLFSVFENESADPVNENIRRDLCNSSSSLFLNATERIRLTKELNNWGTRYNAEFYRQYEQHIHRHQQQQRIDLLNRFRTNPQQTDNSGSSSGDTSHKMRMRRSSESGQQVQIYQRNKGYKLFDSFIDDIGRSSDTLYFVSLHSDNLIFPATHINKSLPVPKITLLLPAIMKHGDNDYKMMKIDCSVQNFTIVSLKQTP